MSMASDSFRDYRNHMDKATAEITRLRTLVAAKDKVIGAKNWALREVVRCNVNTCKTCNGFAQAALEKQ